MARSSDTFLPLLAALIAVATACTAGPAAPPPGTSTALPELPDRGGITLRKTTVVTITAANDTDGERLAAFGEALVKSAWWHALAAEYPVDPAPTAAHVTGPALTDATMDEAALDQYILSAVSSANGPAPDGATLYVLYLPPNVSVIDPSTHQPNTNCHGFRGYHTLLAGTRRADARAVIQRCPASRVEAVFDRTTRTASHEIAESATDPVPGRGYSLPDAPSPRWNGTVWQSFEPGGIENADLCHDTRWSEGGFWYERFWSNTAARSGEGDPCVPAVAGPYVNTTAPEQWYAVAPGASVDVPIRGFSTGASPDWFVIAAPVDANTPHATVSLASDTHAERNGTTTATLNDGRSAVLHVTVPADAPRGSSTVIWVASVPPGTDADLTHLWPVGVYVPPS